MLGFVPTNEKAALIKNGGIDEWGLTTSKGEKIEFNCYIRESVTAEKIGTHDGNTAFIKYTLTIEGKADIRLGDFVEVYGVPMKVLKVSYLKDLSRRILATSVMV